jgi:hypothetical protein
MTPKAAHVDCGTTKIDDTESVHIKRLNGAGEDTSPVYSIVAELRS